MFRTRQCRIRTQSLLALPEQNRTEQIAMLSAECVHICHRRPAIYTRRRASDDTALPVPDAHRSHLCPPGRTNAPAVPESPRRQHLSPPVRPRQSVVCRKCIYNRATQLSGRSRRWQAVRHWALAAALSQRVPTPTARPPCSVRLNIASYGARAHRRSRATGLEI